MRQVFAHSASVANRTWDAHLTVGQKELPGHVEEKKGATSSRWRRTLLDPSTLALLVSNVFVIAFAYDQQWNLITLLWIYWAQSVIIGVFNVLKIFDLTHFSTDGFYINGRTVAPTEVTKRKTALFFAFHYGIFHAAYFVFLVVFTFFGLWQAPAGATTAASALFVLASIALFSANHLHSFLHNRERERAPSIIIADYDSEIPKGENAMIRGRLVDERGKGVANAEVSYLYREPGTGWHAVNDHWLTDETGAFVVPCQLFETADVQICYPPYGYKSYSKTITISVIE